MGEAPWKRIFFVCQNQKDGKPSCHPRGSEAVYAKLKAHLKANPALKREVRVTTSGCLDNCDFGPTIVVYPEGTMYAGVTEADCGEIISQHLEKGERVERLVFTPARAAELLKKG